MGEAGTPVTHMSKKEKQQRLRNCRRSLKTDIETPRVPSLPLVFEPANTSTQFSERSLGSQDTWSTEEPGSDLSSFIVSDREMIADGQNTTVSEKASSQTASSREEEEASRKTKIHQEEEEKEDEPEVKKKCTNNLRASASGYTQRTGEWVSSMKPARRGKMVCHHRDEQDYLKATCEYKFEDDEEPQLTISRRTSALKFEVKHREMPEFLRVLDRIGVRWAEEMRTEKRQDFSLSTKREPIITVSLKTEYFCGTERFNVVLSRGNFKLSFNAYRVPKLLSIVRVMLLKM